MTKKLLDDKEPWEIVDEIDRDGEHIWVRKDGVELTDMRKNPFYVLATIAGEQTGPEFDGDLHEKNRRYWNGWACAGIEVAERQKFARQVELKPADLAPLSEGERQKLEQAFRERLPDTDLPKPGKIVVSGTYLPKNTDVSFVKYVFPGTANFSHATFSGAADFSSATFCGYADFYYATFSDYAVFSSATFSGPISFSSATFSGSADFSSAIFSGDTDFSSATLSGSADFSSATFSSRSLFESATFNGIAVFRTASFGGPAAFESATFRDDAVFSFANFIGPAVFRSATFNDGGFGSATFRGPAYLSSATFNGIADFESATFQGRADFESATLSGPASFRSTVFESVTDFRMATFVHHAPAFQACTLYQDTRFTTAGALWPTPTAETAEDDKSAYVRLRQLMNELHKPDDEHFFFRQEMRCEERLRSGWDWLVVWLFGQFSDFGHSVTRPALWLLGTIAAGWLANLSVFAWQQVLEGGTKTGWEAFGLSFSNTFAFLGFARLYFGPGYFAEDFPAALKVLGAGQTLLGVVFLFFLGLGLRNRFRLK